MSVIGSWSKIFSSKDNTELENDLKLISSQIKSNVVPKKLVLENYIIL